MSFSNLRFIAFLLVCGVAMLLHSCTETETPDDCSISINSFNVSPTSFAAGATLTGSISFSDNVGLDNLTARNVAELYLSSDNSYSSGDVQLDAFTDPATLNGSTYSVNFNQIDIPFGTASGSYHIIARIAAQNCGGGVSSSAVTSSKAVTVN